MELGRTSFAPQNPIEIGTFQAMSLRKCALTAFPFNRGPEEDKKIVVFNNLRRTGQFADEQISTSPAL